MCGRSSQNRVTTGFRVVSCCMPELDVKVAGLFFRRAYLYVCDYVSQTPRIMACRSLLFVARWPVAGKIPVLYMVLCSSCVF